ncbi:MAG: hypothetical protein CM15mP21_4300 [Hyphomicrobiales bacterium]|nr:MAG: hypothetical protein CM15mP21_4300 [Hyphomicrobiales bacterium]
MKTYVHLGTGNYHPQNAKVYTDLSCSPATGNSWRCGASVQLLHWIAEPKNLKKLAMSPLTLRKSLMERIANKMSTPRPDAPGNLGEDECIG